MSDPAATTTPAADATPAGTPPAGTPAADPAAGAGTGLLANAPEGDGGDKAIAYTDFKFPKDSEPLAGDRLTEFHTLAGGLKLTQDQAQQLVDYGAKYRDAVLAGVKEQETAMRAEWAETSSKDPEIMGKDGSELHKNLGIARDAVLKTGGKELMELLSASGLEDNPVVIKAFLKLGRLMTEDAPGARHLLGGNEPKKTVAEIFYPDMAAGRPH